jgi:uncharacterized protein (TIGR03083 family)
MVLDAFLDTAERVEAVLALPEVAERWHEPSALEGHTVATLAAHLARAAFTVQRYLDVPPGDGAPTTAAGYLVAALGTADPIDSDLHRSVRERAREDAEAGAAALVDRFRRTRLEVADRLTASDPQQLIGVLDGIVLPVEEYLRTRILELVIHLDDLSVSLGIEPPDLSDEAFDITAATLAQVAVRRVGPWATLRSLARAERQPEPVRAL